MENKLEAAVREILKQLGEDPRREGLEKTPRRMAKALREITCGYSIDIDKIFNGAFFKVNYKEMVMVRDISFYSMCEHHMLPFFGKVHLAYIPNGRIIGLSKIPRLVEAFSRRLQVQERLTTQIAEIIMSKLKPLGVMVVIEAEHMCMSMRGVKKPGTLTVTSAVRGIFKENEKTRSETLALMK